MVRRFYIAGGNNVGDPAVNTRTITDEYFEGKEISGVFKEGFRYYEPGIEWQISDDGLTITVSAGPTFAIDEVIIVEVGPKKTGIDCNSTLGEVSDVDLWLPDILKCVIARVNTVFENREDDPFSVMFYKGTYEQAGKDKFYSNASASAVYVWLRYPFDLDPPTDSSYFKDSRCDLFILVKTEYGYTQQQREDINYHPRLAPVYKQIIYELNNESKLVPQDQIPHRLQPEFYWGGGDVNGPGQPNVWQEFVDANCILNLKLKIGHIENCVFTSNF